MESAAYLESFEEAYRQEFTSRVVARPPGAVVLDRTWFYPEGGGQPSDTGYLTSETGGRFPVSQVRKVGDSILHRLGKPEPAGAPALQVGEEVRGEIDFERRRRHMRLHTAQHLVSGVLFTMTGRRTRKAIMGGKEAIIDLDGPWPPDVEWDRVTGSVRDAIGPSRALRIHFVPRSEWDAHPSPRTGLIPLAPQVDPVRVIEIEGLDRCPCGGTHLRSTGEIGPLELLPPRPDSPSARVVLRLP